MSGPEVYGITGRKRHGKDTFARMVRGAVDYLMPYEASPFAVMHFADDLKRKAARAFGVAEEHFYDDALKDAALRAPVALDDYLVDMRDVTGLASIQRHGLVARTPRQLAQYFGTDYVRAADAGYWTRRVMSAARGRTLVPDTRFPDEADALRAIGGRVVKIVRADAPASTDDHDSERAIDQIKADLLLVVPTGDLQNARQAALMIALGRFDLAMAFGQKE